jgi:H+/gluconate symporter-like permease
VPPIGHELNLTTQTILTYGSWVLTAVILVLAIWMGMRERTPFYALMVLAVLVGAFAEPLYDATWCSTLSRRFISLARSPWEQ